MNVKQINIEIIGEEGRATVAIADVPGCLELLTTGLGEDSKSVAMAREALALATLVLETDLVSVCRVTEGGERVYADERHIEICPATVSRFFPALPVLRAPVLAVGNAAGDSADSGQSESAVQTVATPEAKQMTDFVDRVVETIENTPAEGTEDQQQTS